MRNETNPKKIVIAVVAGLIAVIAIGLFFSGMLRVQTHQEYGYIDYDGQYGKAEYCAEHYGAMTCKTNGRTFNVKEFWLLAEER